MKSVCIIGVGKMGGALAIVLARAGYNLDSFLFRENPTKAEQIADNLDVRPNIHRFSDVGSIGQDIVIIATGDEEIGGVADELAGIIDKRCTVFHVSGSLSSTVLAGIEKVGCDIGSIHPLLSISDSIRGADSFAGAYFCIEGDQKAVEIGQAIAKDLGGHSFSIATDKKSLYHAAAVTASGHLVALIDASLAMLAECGLPSGDAIRVLLPLIESTVENLAQQHPSQALTGSFARGDAKAVAQHLRALNGLSDDVKNIYMILGERSLELALRSGIDQEKVAAIRREILLAKKIGEC